MGFLIRLVQMVHLSLAEVKIIAIVNPKYSKTRSWNKKTHGWQSGIILCFLDK